MHAHRQPDPVDGRHVAGFGMTRGIVGGGGLGVAGVEGGKEEEF